MRQLKTMDHLAQPYSDRDAIRMSLLMWAGELEFRKEEDGISDEDEYLLKKMLELYRNLKNKNFKLTI